MTSVERIELLPGRSSVQLDQMFAGPFMVTCLAFLPLVMARTLESTFDLHIPGPVLGVASIAAVFFGIPTLLFLAISLRRRAQEERAGYTLVSRRRLDLPQLEPRSGIVIRVVSEPHPEFREIRRRYLAARALP